MVVVVVGVGGIRLYVDKKRWTNVIMFRRPPPKEGIVNLEQLRELLASNKGTTIIKFSAGWCGPCQRILPQFNMLAENATANGVLVIKIDIDECMDIYQYYKSKKMINGVPTVMAFYGENTSMYPDHVVIGADPTQLNLFFSKVLLHK